MNEKHGVFKYQYSSSSHACYVSIEAKFGEIITLQISEVNDIYCGHSKILIYDSYDGIYELDHFCLQNSSFNEHTAVKFESKSGKMVLIYKGNSNPQSSFFGEYFVKNDLSDPVVFKHQSSLQTVNETHFLFVTRKNLLSVFTRPINSSVWNDPAEHFNATRSRFHSSLVLADQACVYDSLLVDETVHCFHVFRAVLQRAVFKSLSRDPVGITPLVGPSLVAVGRLKFLVVGGYEPLSSYPNRNVWAVDLSTGLKEVLNFTLPQDIRMQEKSTVYVDDRLFVEGKTETNLKSEPVLIYYDFNSSLFKHFDTKHLTDVDKFYWCEVDTYYIAIVVSKNETFLYFPLHNYWLSISSIVKVNLYVSENLDRSLFYCFLSHTLNLNLKLYYESNSNFWTVFQTEEVCLAAKSSFECLNILGDSCDIYQCVNGGHTCRKKLKPTLDNLNKTFLCDNYISNDLNFTLASTNQTRPLCKCLGNGNVNCINCESVGCSAYNECTRCNQSPYCQWSARYNFCEVKSSQKEKSVCAISVVQGYNQCQTVNTCVECMKYSDCGWMSTGKNWCVPGNLQRPLYHHFSLALDVLRKGGSDKTSWNFLRCPLYDECAEGSHDCAENEACVDEVRGWTCVCKDGYERPSVGGSCRPVCSQPCSNGNCTKPNFCDCFHGFYGSSCGLACPCNQNSRCDVVSGQVKCLKCENNTAGDRCQLCEKNHIRLNKACRSCMSMCNMKTDECDVSPSGAVTCRGCQGNAWGEKCEKCEEGYFNLDGECKRCRCNNEDNLCNPETGGNCRCGGKSESSKQECAGYNPPSSLQCWKFQCDKCKAGYIGQPTGGSLCYKWLHNSDQHCFDPDLPGNCYDHRGYDDEKTHVEAGQVVAYALQPKPASKADYRVYVDVWMGEVDVYLVFDAQSYFVVERNDTGEHVEKVIDLKTTSGLRYKKISYKKSEHMRSQFYHVTMKKKEALKVEGVAGRLVVTRKHTKKDQGRGFLYVIVRAKSGPKIRKRSVERKGASGRIAFRQDEPRLDLFVFFSSFFSLCGILSVLITSMWKFRRMVNNRRARINHQLQMIPLARRPFRLVHVCIDDNQPQDGCRESEEKLLLPSGDDEKPVRNLKGILNKKPKSPDKASRVKHNADDTQQDDDSPKSSPQKMVRFASSPNIVRFEVPDVEILKTHCRPVVVQPTSSNLSQGVITYIATLPATNSGDNCQKPVVFLSTLASLEREDEDAEDFVADEERKKRKKFKFCGRAQSEF